MGETNEELKAVEKLKGASLSPAARANLDAIEAELRAKETETWMDRFKSRVWKVMKWAGIGAVGVATVGGVAYVGKQAADAFPAAVETAANREVNERMTAINASFEGLKASSGTLLLKMLDFMIALKDKGSTYEGLSSMAVTTWEGIWADSAELITSGDTSPDHIIAKMKEIVTADPILATKMEAIFASYEDLKKKKDAFVASGQQAIEFNDQDAQELWVDYKREFWTEMLDKRDALK